MILRIGYNLFVLCSIIVLPWYSYALFIVAGFLLFDIFFEGIFWAIVIDSVYGVGIQDGFSVFSVWHHHWFTVVAVVAFASTQWVKQYISWYD